MTTSEPSRTPPVAVRQLRAEVGFGCPVLGCGVPYLDYHHFDPQWAARKHHNPDGMLALCSIHHAQADSLTIAQCRRLKTVDRARPDIAGRLWWMRDDILAIVGRCYYYETPEIIVFRGQPLIWFRRDSERRLLLNMRSLAVSPVAGRLGITPRRMAMNDNDWIIPSRPADVDSPPKGNRLEVNYSNGDYVRIRFREWKSTEALLASHPAVWRTAQEWTYPLASCEIMLSAGDGEFELKPESSTFPGGITFAGGVFERCQIGMDLRRPASHLPGALASRWPPDTGGKHPQGAALANQADAVTRRSRRLNARVGPRAAGLDAVLGPVIGDPRKLLNDAAAKFPISFRGLVQRSIRRSVLVGRSAGWPGGDAYGGPNGRA